MSGADLDEYASFFARATGGLSPHGYQRRVAEGVRLPELIEIPPGYGKTAAIVLAWLWRRRFHPNLDLRTRTPRRLVYALPQRALTDQIAREVARWLAALAIDTQVAMHVIMGGRGEAGKPWRSAPEADSVLIGTIDMITSKALVRAYGTPRNVFPMDAALVWNDSHIVVDEVQQAPASTTTLRQVDAFRTGNIAGSGGLTCMSATIPRELIDTVDNPFPDVSQVVRLGDGDNTEDLNRRRSATRLVQQLQLQGADPKAIAAHLVERHRPGTFTLAIANTVKSAREIEKAVRRLKPHADLVLLHSQFRPVDRAPKVEALSSPNPPQGRIAVSTQVVEAGIDLDAAVLVTEVAPWSSLIQRSGRCNRRGLTNDAELWWYQPAKAPPYSPDELAETERALTEFEGRLVTSETLLEAPVTSKPRYPLMLRRSDFASLFDTSPDLSGHDLDIAPYVRDTEELSVQICWMTWEGTRPPDRIKLLNPDYRCRVPIGGVAEMLKAGKQVWQFSPVDGVWHTLDSRSRARPGDVLLVSASSGGYSMDVGFEPASARLVSIPVEHDDWPGSEAVAEDAAGVDTRAFSAEWVPLNQHLEETAAEATRLTKQIVLPPAQASDVVLAARVHDIGKAHPAWQDALCATASDADRDHVEEGRPWAKSANSQGRLRYSHGITGFRHELAGMLLLEGPFAGLLGQAHDPDLVRYLVLAHHGKLRVQVRDPDPSKPGQLFGMTDEDPVDVSAVLDRPAATLNTSLSRFSMGGDSAAGVVAWADAVAALVERYGVFRLAYLETLVRIADWRASALHDVKGGHQ